MKRSRICLAALALCLAALLTACACEHVWTMPTCTKPKICLECGETSGEPRGHSWVEATATHPRFCTICGETEGETLGVPTEPGETSDDLTALHELIDCVNNVGYAVADIRAGYTIVMTIDADYYGEAMMRIVELAQAATDIVKAHADELPGMPELISELNREIDAAIHAWADTAGTPDGVTVMRAFAEFYSDEDGWWLGRFVPTTHAIAGR